MVEDEGKIDAWAPLVRFEWGMERIPKENELWQGLTRKMCVLMCVRMYVCVYIFAHVFCKNVYCMYFSHSLHFPFYSSSM